MTALDPRLNAYRPDLADERLRGRVEAERFVAGRLARVSAGFADLRRAPSLEAGLDTQLLRGDEVTVFDERDGWAWVQAAHDGYTGYAPADRLGAPDEQPDHRVCVPRTFLYPEPDLKRPPIDHLPLGARVTVVGEAETRGAAYKLLSSGGAVFARHLAPLSQRADDYVAVAGTLTHVPYLWGGTTTFGVDCSGLVQLAMRLTGRHVPRDTDHQADGLGSPIAAPGELPPQLRRGDLVFWAGHVAIMLDADELIHASGHAMMVVRELLAGAIERIAPVHGRPTVYRRP